MKQVLQNATCLLLIFIIIAASSSCSPANKDISGPPLTAASMPAYEPSATVSSPSITPTHPAQATIIPECRETNSKLYDVQTDYLGLIPGKTRQSEVAQFVGEPNEKTDFPEWIYDDFVIIFEGNVVDNIVIYSDSNLMRPLADIVEKFGCPGFVFAVDTSASEVSDYFLFTSMVYQNMELEFFFGKYPVSLSDAPAHVVLRGPETKDQFLQRMSFVDSDLGVNGIVSWGEAVKE